MAAMFPLINLDTEVRTKILKLLLVQYQWRKYLAADRQLTQPDSTAYDRPFQLRNTAELSPQILRTCRQLSPEGLLILYGSNNFGLDHRNHDEPTSLLPLLDKIGLGSVSLIRNLSVLIDGSEWHVWRKEPDGMNKTLKDVFFGYPNLRNTQARHHLDPGYLSRQVEDVHRLYGTNVRISTNRAVGRTNRVQ